MINSQLITTTRRGFLAAAGLTATAAWAAPHRIFARGADTNPVRDDGFVALTRSKAATAKVTRQTLRGNIDVLLGAGGNIAVLAGPDGKMLIDSGISTARPQVTEAVAQVSADPIRYLINTHWHFDHTDGNEWVRAAGATILAHENCRKHLAAATRVEDWDFTFPPAPAAALPSIGLKGSMPESAVRLHVNGSDIELQAFEPGHTDGDIAVSFLDSDVIHVGDTWWNGRYPFIDYSTGGSIDGMIRAAEATLARVGAKTIIIPGHGPVGDKAQLTEFRDMLATVRDKVGALKKQGQSLQDVVAARPTATFDARWGTFRIDGEFFTRLVYKGV